MLSQFPLDTINVLLVRPWVSFMITHGPYLPALSVVLPGFTKTGRKPTTHVFIPICNRHELSPAEEGEFHWSLLVASIYDRLIVHYDSRASHNEKVAMAGAAKLQKLLEFEAPVGLWGSELQQGEPSDGGVFVCSVIRHLLFNRIIATEATQMTSVVIQSKLDFARERKEFMRIVWNLRNRRVDSDEVALERRQNYLTWLHSKVDGAVVDRLNLRS